VTRAHTHTKWRRWRGSAFAAVVSAFVVGLLALGSTATSWAADAGAHSHKDSGAVADAGAADDAGVEQEDDEPSGTDPGPSMAPPARPRPGAPATDVVAIDAGPPVISLSLAPAREPAADGGAGDGGAPPEVEVDLANRPVFVLQVARGGQTAKVRAVAAAQVLSRLAEEKDEPEIVVRAAPDGLQIIGGDQRIVELGENDAAAAGVDSLEAYAADIAGAIRTVIHAERRRASIANTVSSVSLLVFVGLIAWLVLQRISRTQRLLQRWVRSQPDKIDGLKLGDIEVVSSTAVRGAADVLSGVAGRLIQIVIVYTWAVFSLSLFDRTRGYAEHITGMVTAPLWSTMARLGGAVPILVFVVIVVFLVGLLIRFVSLFFGSVSRGETNVSWLPADLAAPTGVLVRIAIVAVTLLLGGPLLTSGGDGALAALGAAAAATIGLACVPLLATVAVGTVVIYGRRIRRGDRVEWAGKSGKVESVSLLDVRLADDAGGTVRLPHLASLLRPVRIGGVRRRRLLVTVALPPVPETTATTEEGGSETAVQHAAAALDGLRAVLVGAAVKVGSDVDVELVAGDALSARFVIACRPIGDSDLGSAVMAALAASDVPLASFSVRARPLAPGADLAADIDERARE
jgi:small-conductance mechanosensitive channel